MQTSVVVLLLLSPMVAMILHLRSRDIGQVAQNSIRGELSEDCHQIERTGERGCL